MGTGTLTIDLDAVVANWRALDRLSAPHVETAAVVKADAYGLGAGRVARALARAGARRFFVAQAEEGATVRSALGHGPQVCVFAGHMSGDTALLRDLALVPMLTSPDQAVRHAEAMPGSPFGVQLDTGMHRLGLTPADWRTWRDVLLNRAPVLLMSHLACADDPHDAMNARQLALFARMTDGAGVPRTLAATGGILLGDAWHFDVVRPGIGLYGGAPFEAAAPVVRLSLPVIQVRDVAAGGTVGYSAAWIAESDARIATVAAGYADGLLRAMGDRAVLFAGDVPCPLAGRVSMDLMTVDVTHLAEVPESLDILAPSQTVDDLAAAAATIGYEILTSLGPRYARRYTGATGPAPHPRAPIRREPLQRTTRSR